jgi:Flp pilus assembly protein TadG
MASRDDGAVMVESALVLPVILVITMVIIELGMFFSTTSTTSSAARDGGRHAAANFAPAGDRNLVVQAVIDVVERDLDALTGLGTPEVAWVYAADADGTPRGSSDFSSCTTDCWRFDWNGSQFVAAGSEPWTDPDACVTTSDRTVDSIGVYVKVRHTLLTGILTGGTRTIDQNGVYRLEPLPSPQCA